MTQAACILIFDDGDVRIVIFNDGIRHPQKERCRLAAAIVICGDAFDCEKWK